MGLCISVAGLRFPQAQWNCQDLGSSRKVDTWEMWGAAQVAFLLKAEFLVGFKIPEGARIYQQDTEAQEGRSRDNMATLRNVVFVVRHSSWYGTIPRYRRVSVRCASTRQASKPPVFVTS